MSRHPATRFFLGLTFFFVACKGAGSAPPGGGGGGGGATGAAGTAGASLARPLCTSPQGLVLPATFDTSCGQGSNLALCASTTATQCSGGACLWDAARATATCTIGCDPAGALSCPARFACKANQCADGPAHVCVRTAERPTQDCSAISPVATDQFFKYVAADDGQLYVIGQNAAREILVFHRAVNAVAWTQILKRPALAFFAGTQATTISTGDAVYYTLGDGKLLRLVGATATEETFQTCTPPCTRRLVEYFRTPTGGLRAFTGVEGEIIERDAQGTWNVAITALPRRVDFLAHFRDSGFVGPCQAEGAAFGDPYGQLCTSGTGEELAVIALPPGEEPIGAAESIFGASPADFLMFFKSQNLYHRVGDGWVKEGLPPRPADANYEGGALIQFPEGTLYAETGAGLWKLSGSCWAPTSGEVGGGVPLRGGAIGWATMGDWCEEPRP